MAKELKIITDGLASHTKVFVGDKQIGLIQKITFIAANDNLTNNIEIVFPDLLSLPSHLNSDIVRSLKENLELLKEIPNVKIILEKLFFEDS